MVIAGAGGHAIEVLDVLLDSGYKDSIYFYDDINTQPTSRIFDEYRILKSIFELAEVFNDNSDFCLGLGNPSKRKLMSKKLQDAGGNLVTIKSKTSVVGKHNCYFASGLNIMHQVLISSQTQIGEGVLLNSKCEVHHHTQVGEYSEICPSVQLLGNVSVGEMCFIGTGSIILPNVSIGKNVIIGAGLTIKKDIPDGAKIKEGFS